MSRVRHSLREIQDKYETGVDRSTLENLIRAFRGIQELSSKDPNSFFILAGYHGEPFRGKGKTDPEWWGGYCNHANVLFPVWHRAYLMQFENALRTIPGCQDVSLPFWDEVFAAGSGQPIPSVLTSPTFDLDGRTDNPLYSYKLQDALNEQVNGARWSKHVGYETVRYPLSGLVGTERDRIATKIHNAFYRDPAKNTKILNDNVDAWLIGTVDIPDDESKTRRPDTYSIKSGFGTCLEAPNYTVFSNTTSQTAWTKEHSEYVVALENPHNAMHLAVGGFYWKGQLNASPIRGANGDMGDNETASFDPIFFFHHSFIDYVFWTWQKKHHLTAAGSLTIMDGYPGTKAEEGLPDINPGTPLTMATSLFPFKKSDGSYYTPSDVTDIQKQLDYTYGFGSLDPFINRSEQGSLHTAPIVKIQPMGKFNRANYAGSFIIRTYAEGPGVPKRVEIAREPILSRWNVVGCANCQNSLEVEPLVPLDETLLSTLRGKGKEEDIKYSVEVETHTARALNGSYMAVQASED